MIYNILVNNVASRIIIIYITCCTSIIRMRNRNITNLTCLSHMEFPTLISWTSPFLNQGYYDGILCFVQILIKNLFAQEFCFNNFKRYSIKTNTFHYNSLLPLQRIAATWISVKVPYATLT